MKFVYPRTLNYFWMLQRPQQIMRALASKGHECHFINSFNPHLNSSDQIIEEKTEIEPNLFLYPHDTDIYDLDFDILYYSYPMQEPLARSLKNEKNCMVIFDSVDEPDGSFEFWNRGGMYNKALVSADAILATAKTLKQRIEQENHKCNLIPNGCDFEHFSKTKPHENCYDIDHLIHPKIVYSGAIATWLDWKLIEKITNKYSFYDFIFIGYRFQQEIDTSKLRERKNVHFLGGKDYQDLPKYFQQANIFIIPFDVNDPVTKSTNPIKLWEYFATGKPVVTTAMNECQIGVNEKPYPLVYYSKDHNEFIQNIDKALYEVKSTWRNGWESAFERMMIASNNSWSNRVDEILKIIGDYKCGEKP